MSGNKLKATARTLSIFPVIVLLVLIIAELMGGERSVVEHLAQMVPLVLLIMAAWRWPREGGIMLTIAAVGLAMVYPVMIGLSLMTIVITEILLFLPAIIAGGLFIAAARRENGQGTRLHTRGIAHH